MTSKEDDLEVMINSLPKELPPKNELWDRIDKRLDVPVTTLKAANSNRSWYSAAAAVILLIGLFANNQLGQLNTDVDPLENNSALLTTLVEIRANHKIQVNQLQQAGELVNWQQSPYSSPLETGIEQLREAAELIYQSLKLTPTDQQLWQLWLWTQAREIELLKQGQKLPASNNSQGNMI